MYLDFINESEALQSARFFPFGSYSLLPCPHMPDWTICLKMEAQDLVDELNKVSHAIDWLLIYCQNASIEQKDASLSATIWLFSFKPWLVKSLPGSEECLTISPGSPASLPASTKYDSPPASPQAVPGPFPSWLALRSLASSLAALTWHLWIKPLSFFTEHPAATLVSLFIIPLFILIN